VSTGSHGADSRAPRVAVLGAGLRLAPLVLRADSRRASSWLALAGPIIGLLALPQVPDAVRTMVAWADGVVAGVIATGVLPGSYGMPIPAVSGRRLQRTEYGWLLERLAWPLLGAGIGCVGTGQEADGGIVVALGGGILASGLLMAGCRWVGCTDADAASGTLGITVTAIAVIHAFLPGLSTGVSPAVPVGFLAALWVGLALLFLTSAAQLDRRVAITRDLAINGVSLGHSEIRRWMVRLMMISALLSMVRWLFATEPSVENYGIPGVLFAASLMFPEAVLRTRGSQPRLRAHIAWVEGRQRSLWRHSHTWLLPAVVVGWPLMIAVVLTPAARGSETVLLACGIFCVVAFAFAGNIAVAKGWILGETAFAIIVLVAWHATTGCLENSGERPTQSAEARLPRDVFGLAWP
jgi:hypothetical protein